MTFNYFQIFWFVYLIGQSFDLYSYIHVYLSDDGLPHFLPFATFLTSMILDVASLVCHFFVEPKPEYQVNSKLFILFDKY